MIKSVTTREGTTPVLIPEIASAMAVSDTIRSGLIGGEGDDSLIGTSESEVIDGREGADTLWGMGGNDSLVGYFGNDSLNGGDGADYLMGYSGQDTLDGAAGDDLIRSFRNPSIMDGGAGYDQIGLYRQNQTLSYVLDTAAMATETGATLADGSVIRNI